MASRQVGAPWQIANGPAQDHILPAPARTVTVRRRSTRSPTPAAGEHACIAGRDGELDSITQFLDCLVARPEILVLEGEPGIGKTTLWLAAVEQARERGFRVLSCRPSAAEARLSHSSLADVLTGACDSVADALPVPQRRAIDAVLLRTDDDGAVSDHRAAGAALLSVLNRLAADMPVLLAIDDYQWVDTPSARVIEFAIRRLSAPTGVLAALRTGERGQEPWLGCPIRGVSDGCGWGR